MGIRNIELLFPVDDPYKGMDFFVENSGGGIFTISGPDDAVHMTDSTHFQLNTPHVTDHGDGTYTAVTG